MAKDSRGGKRGAGAAGGGLINQVTDNLDFRAFVKENMSNPEFKKFGRDNGIDAVKQLWYEKRAQEEIRNIHEISKEEAIEQVRDAISNSTLDGWFRNTNSDYKPKLIDSVMQSPGTLNAGLNIAYINYKAELSASNVKNGTNKQPLSFKKWVNTPQDVYRGDKGQQTTSGDIFLSFSTNKEVAQSFGSNITKKKVKSIDTWGSYQTTGESEWLVPLDIKKKKK